VVFATEPVPFAIREPLPGVDLDATERPGIGVVLWFRTNDAQALHDRLAAAGVRIVKAPEDSPCGRTLTFVGPEGMPLPCTKADHDHDHGRGQFAVPDFTPASYPRGVRIQLEDTVRTL
jgi:hypothetical protein